MVEYNDARIVEGLKRGEQVAFGHFYNKYAPLLLGHLTRMVQNRELAEELLQECFMLIIKKIDSFSFKDATNTGFKAWVFRVATNSAIDNLRKQKRRSNIWDRAQDDPIQAQEEAALSAEQEAIYKEEDASIEKLLAKLPLSQRTFFHLRVQEGLSYGEISDVTGSSVNSVKQGLFRARNSLKKWIGENEELAI